MKTMQRVSLVFGLFAVLAASHPAGAADVAKGGDVFAEECAECHSVREGKKFRVLWTSEGFHDLALMASSKVPEQDVKAVASAFMASASSM